MLNLSFTDTYKGEEIVVYVNELENDIISCKADYKFQVGLSCTKNLFKEALYMAKDIINEELLTKAGKQYVAHLDKFYIGD